MYRPGAKTPKCRGHAVPTGIGAKERYDFDAQKRGKREQVPDGAAFQARRLDYSGVSLSDIVCPARSARVASDSDPGAVQSDG